MKKLFIILCLCGTIAFVPINIPQNSKASLVVTVRNELGNTVADATVQLYKKRDNYLKETNSLQRGITNKKGVVKFKKLGEVSYFIWVKKGDINNAGGGERISELKNGKINKITVIIQ